MEHLPSLTNVYQLLGFLLMIALQVYTRWSVSQVAKKQDAANEKLDLNRAHLANLISSTADRIAGQDVHLADVVEAVEQALKVAYHQGEVDSGKSVPFPTERIKAAARQIVDIVRKATEAGAGETIVSAPHPKPEQGGPDVAHGRSGFVSQPPQS